MPVDQVDCAESVQPLHRGVCVLQVWDTALRMLCKYRGLQDAPRFKEFMEIQVGALARKPVRARCAAAAAPQTTYLCCKSLRRRWSTETMRPSI